MQALSTTAKYSVLLAESDAEIAACYPVMAQLRPHLVEGEFVDRVRRQAKNHGYRLAYIATDGRPAAMAGFRIAECLAWSKFMYVDDLVTDERLRSRGMGQALMDWLIAHARESGCAQFHLDSGVQRFGAHRFYLANRMAISSHHFGLELGQG